MFKPNQTLIGKMLALMLCLSMSQTVFSQKVITQWDFNSDPADNNLATGSFLPSIGKGTTEREGGTNRGFGSGSQNGGSTDLAPNTDNSAMNITNFPTQGTGNKTRGVSFTVSTKKFQDIKLSWDIRPAVNAANKMVLLYSTDSGTTFTEFTTYTFTAGNIWYKNQMADLSSITALNDANQVIFKFVAAFDGAQYEPATSTSTYNRGQWRFDMVTVSGNPTPGKMRITEFMYDGAPGEFVEFTNIGGSEVDMTGWSFDDNSRLPGSQSLSAFGVVKAGESVILTEASETVFASAWDLPSSVKIIGGLTNNLGRNDEINLYDETDALIDRLTYNDQGAAPFNVGRAQNFSAWAAENVLGTNTANLWLLSSIGDAKLSFSNTSGAIGNPGVYFIEAGFQVLQSGGSTSVEEGGNTDTYSVRLKTQPTHDVTVNMTPDAQLSLSATTLTFTPLNWNIAQTVTVSAIDDAIQEGSHSGVISFSVTSSDIDYNAISIASITSTIADNDVPKPLVRITEYMYTGNGQEFVEFTNVGSIDVDMTGWSYSDNARTPGAFSLSGFGILKAGESVLVVQDLVSNFRSDWGLCNGIRIIGGVGNLLGRSDEINLYDASNVLQDRLTYNDQGASPLNGPRTQNASAWPSTSALGQNLANEWTLSTVGDGEGSKAATSGDIGSPGFSTKATVTFNPCFVDPNTPIIEFDATNTSDFLDGGSLSLPAVAASLAMTDPTDPARTLGINFTITDPQGASTTTVTAESDNTTVVSNSDITVIGSGTSNVNVKIKAQAKGYAKITVTVTDGVLSSSYTINYAASDAAMTSSRFHAGKADASTAQAIDQDYVFIADDEDQKIRLYDRRNSGLPLKSFDFSTGVGLTASDEVDIEASTRTGNTIYWIGSHSNTSGGNEDPDRERIFSTTISGTGTSTTLTFGGYYRHLVSDLSAWDNSNAHGLGANYFGLQTSAGSGIIPESNSLNGFSIEGLTFAPNSTTTAYLGFRAPISPASDRTKALVVPVTNFTTILNSTGGSAGSATFGSPILLDLGGRGIRSIECNDEGCLILAGNANAGANFKLYAWSGKPNDKPYMLNNDLSATTFTGAGNVGSLESFVELPSGAFNTWSGQTIQLLFDNGDTDFYGDGKRAKDLSQTSLQKFRSEPIVLDIPEPSISVKGNGNAIASGSTTTSDTNHTAYPITAVNTSFTRTFVIQNTGNRSMNISSVQLQTPAPFSVESVPTTIAVNASANLVVKFSPTAKNTFSNTVTINSDAINAPVFEFAISAESETTYKFENGVWIPELPVNSNGDFEIPSGYELTIKSGENFTLPSGTKLISSSPITIESGATALIEGTIEGEVTNFGTLTLKGSIKKLTNRGKVRYR